MTTAARASREVIVSAGSIATPQILMLSGVGPAEQLRAHGIDIIAESPGVGRNLQEHPVTGMIWNVDVPTLNEEFTPKGMLRHGIQFLLNGSGAAASSIFHALVFAKLDPSASTSQIEVGFAPFAIGATSPNEPGNDPANIQDHDVTRLQLHRESMVSAYVSVLHPRSAECSSYARATPPTILSFATRCWATPGMLSSSWQGAGWSERSSTPSRYAVIL